MSYEDSFNTFEQMLESPIRNQTELMFYDTASRDSGFEEVNVDGLEEDAFFEEFAEINFDENTQLPTDFRNLIQKPIITVTVNQKPTFRRAISSQEDVSPLKKKVCQRADKEDSQSFLIRRKKLVRLSKTEELEACKDENKELKPYSSEEAIKTAIQRSCSEVDLIADFSRSCSLPLTTSRHQDLKAIDGFTLKRLMNGEFRDTVSSFKIIDCRYPYEFNGGHIKGAINIYTHEDCSSLLEETCEKPSVLIFHCEFSAERGPNLYRHLRQEDRKKNAQMYPSLCFPEIYVLEGGYRQFFQENVQLCSPHSYTQMLDPKHAEELTFYRQTSRTWDSDVKCCSKKSVKTRNARKIF